MAPRFARYLKSLTTLDGIVVHGCKRLAAPTLRHHPNGRLSSSFASLQPFLLAQTHVSHAEREHAGRTKGLHTHASIWAIVCLSRARQPAVTLVSLLTCAMLR